ncbi:MAG: hypothetical protein LBC41_11945, partial [Clostridiales bacterium]|nr:hypothetical protein [Clostridiales bacterium]
MKARFKRPSSLILAVVLSLSIINLRAARASEPAPDAVIYLDLEKSVPNTMGVTFFNGVVTISRNGAYKLTQSVGGATVKSVVISANDANIWLDNVNMKAVQGRSAIEAKGKNVTISLAGQNYIQSDLGGIQPFAGTILTIGSFGSLEIAAKYGNAIGSSAFESISITGGTIKASSESTSAIGLSGNPTNAKAVGKSIVINNYAVVEAHGGAGSAAIGIGTNFSGASLESITIADFAKVTAIGGYSGAGIGTGQANNETSIGTISIGSDVTAQGGQFASGIGMGYAFANVSISKIEILYALASATGGELATGIGTGYAYSFAASAIQEIVVQNSLVQAVGGKDAVGIGIAPGAQVSATIKKIDINGSSVKSVGDGKSPGIGISANHMTNAAIDEISLICSMIDAVSAEGPAIGTGVQTTNKSEIKKLQSDADTTIWAESGAGAYGIGYSSPTSTYYEQIGTVLLEGKTFASSVLNDSGNDSLTNLGQLIVAYDPNNGQAIENIYDYDLADIVASGESIRVENVYLKNGDKTLLGWEANGSSSMLQTGDAITSGSALLVEKISPDLNAVKLRAVWSADSTPPSATPQVTPPLGSLPTITPIHTPTNAPQPSNTLTPTPGFDNGSKITNTPIPTVTNAPIPTVTVTPNPIATATNAPSPDKPKPTSTPQITQGPSYIKPYEKPAAPSIETRSAVFASAKDLSIQGSDGTATIEKAEVKEVAEFESMVPASEPFKVVGTAASAIVAAKIETTGVIAAAKYSDDGSADFIDMAFEDGIAALEAKNGDILQLFALEEEKPVDGFLPTYVSREYLDYQQVNEKPKTEYDGFIPDMYNMFGGNTESSNASTKKTVNYDNAYDKKYQSAYDQRGAYYLADVKNQRDTKLCWDFSTMGALEMLMGKIYGKSFDFSESNAAYALSKKAAGFARSPLDAGNFMISAAYLTGEKGPLNEKDEPFDFLFNGKAGVNGSSVADVEEFIIMEYKISDIKDAIQKYGSVVSAIYSTAKEEDTFYYKMKNAAYYMPQSAKAPNHMIQIIGWDNEYPKTNFSQTA